MSRFLLEVLLFVPSALYTGYLLFIALVIQNVMNKLDEATFQRFLNLLEKTATKSPYAIFVGLVPFLGMFPYFIFYGFTNWFYTGGLVVFFIASVISKAINLPLYKKIFELDSTATVELNTERKKLKNANYLRAVIQLTSLVLMIIGLL